MKFILFAAISVVSASLSVDRQSNLKPTHLEEIMRIRMLGQPHIGQFDYSSYLDKWLAYGRKNDIGEDRAHKLVRTKQVSD